MSSIKPNYNTIVACKKCNMAEDQDKDLKIAFTNMLKVIREEIG